LFSEQGYAQTTVGQIAERAGVAVDTIYTSVGRKPAVLRELVETAISGTDQAVPAEQRAYVQRIHGADTAREKLTIYAEAITAIQIRMAPIFGALRDAAITDNDCAALWQEISDRRAGNMLLLAAELRATGDLREDLDDAMVADIIWSMNAAEYWDLLVTRRGWAADEFRDFLADAWHRLLLAGPPSGARRRKSQKGIDRNGDE
jgi:AcrR family transcriptional regulator